jgi:putative endonuclease
MERAFHVYILASQRNGTLYVGVTSNLSRRVFEHREGVIKGFTHRYGVKSLVWYEEFPTALEAIAAEKRIKRWRRAWKLQLIEKINPQWVDLYLSLNS